MQKYFKIRFSIVILLMVVLGAASIYFLNNVYSTTKKMYEHPYTVSNELKSIKISVHQMYLASQHVGEIDYLFLGKQDSDNRERLKVISTQYLGDKEDITEVKRLYEQYFSRNLPIKEAFTNSVKFEQLLLAIDTLSAFSDNTAAELYDAAKQDTQRYSGYIGLALLIAAGVSLYLLIHTLKTLREIAMNRKQYQYLIDQNVMIAAIEDEGKIFEVSSRLSRFISAKKQDLVNHQFKDVFFCHDDEQYEDMWQQVKSGASWHGDIPVADGNTAKWLGVDILPMQNSDYSYSGFRLLAHDITSRKSLEKISITDSLTSLLNRRSFDDVFERQIKLAVRNAQPLTAAMLDVDFFKQYNDAYGHPAGDKVLTHLAALLTKLLGRPDDFVFRMGGEEFFFIFNSQNEADSKLYIDKIREAVKELKIAHKSSSIDDFVTVSIGAVFFGAETMVDRKLLMSDADDNLYRAKEVRNSSVQTVEGIIIL